MVGEQQPLDILDPGAGKMVQHGPVTQIHQNGGIAVADHINIAGIPVQ
jgi:hypothetical protein